MFSGKTDTLLRRVRRAERDGHVTCVAKPVVDTRSGSLIVSHSGARHPAIAVASAADLRAMVTDATVVAVDEVQFLDPEAAIVLAHLRAGGRRVVAAGLNLDFRAEAFPTSSAIERISDCVDRLYAACQSCGRKASLTQRLRDGRPADVFEPVVAIGGAEIYEPRCEICFVFPFGESVSSGAPSTFSSRESRSRSR